MTWRCRVQVASAFAMGMAVAACNDGEGGEVPSLWHTADLAAPPAASATPGLVELGRRLFYDARLSINQGRSCGVCHEQVKGFTDGFPRAVGTTQVVHPRNTLALVNLADRPVLTWKDPGMTRLTSQLLVPLFGTAPVEMGMNEPLLLDRLRAEPLYASLFQQAFASAGSAITVERVVEALVAFENTIVSIDSPFDRYRRGETGALSATALQGMNLFWGRLGCSRCHGGRDLDRPTGPDGRVSGPPGYHNLGLYNIDGLGAYPEGGRGLIEHSGQPGDMGRFRTPTLRNVEVTGPYMHDGTVFTLREAIALHVAGGRNVTVGPHLGDGRASPLRDPLMVPVTVDAADLQAVEVFLRALTDDEFLTRPSLSNPW